MKISDRLFPRKYKELLNKLRSMLTIQLYKLVKESEFMSSLYFALISRAFAREHRGVIYGISEYYTEPKSQQGTQYLLRRNIHRLEKGLIIRPRSDIFALEYIEETVECYKQCVIEESLSDLDELQWSRDVLKNYFEVVSAHPVIENAKIKFNKSTPLPDSDIPNIPYKRDISSSIPVNYEALYNLALRRRSVRYFLPKRIQRALIDKAITIASLSPSACNRQPFEFRIFDDPNLVKEVASIPGGISGFYENIQVIVVIIGKMNAFFIEQDRHLIYIDGSLASMTFIYALETLGLSSCAIKCPDNPAHDKKLSKKLGLKPDEIPILMISLGYPDPDGMVAYSKKKPLHILRNYNKIT